MCYNRIMKTLVPKIEIYKNNEDVSAGDISETLIKELGELFKKHGFFVRIDIRTGQEVEQPTYGNIQMIIKRIFNI